MTTPSSNLQNDTSKIKVAIVDDHRMLRECLFTCLTHWGYSVIIQACNGQDFLDQITQENLPDICILDINMPVLNGAETITILRKTWPEIKILIFSMNVVKVQDGPLAKADAIVSKADGVTKIKTALLSLHCQIESYIPLK